MTRNTVPPGAPRPQGLSFCVISGGHRAERMETLLKSIVRMNVPRYEILVCGSFQPDQRITYFEKPEWAAKAEVCKMRNHNAANTRYDTIVILDDDVEFAPDWWEKIKGEKNFDLAGCRGLGPDGRRWWDYQRVERGNPIAKPVLLEYSETHPDAYISGYFMMMRWEVWHRLKFDENRRNYQHDDIDFCHRVTSAGFSLKVFPAAQVTHHVDPRGREENELARNQFIAASRSVDASPERKAAELLMMREYSRAIEFYRELAKDGSFENIYNLAFCFEQTGARDEALAAYFRAVEAGGGGERQAATHYHIGELLSSHERFEEARSHYRAALELMPDHKKAAAALDSIRERKVAVK